MAQIYITEQDNSLSVVGTSNIIGGMVIVANKGRVGEAVLVDSNTLISQFGKPNPDISTSMYSAMQNLTKANAMYVSRAIHNADGVENDNNRTARYSCALLRAKIAQIQDTTPDLSYTPDKILTPYKNTDGYGLKQSEIDSFTFPLYARSREYKKLKNKIAVDTTNKNYIVVNSFDGMDIGKNLAFGENPNDDSMYFEILSINEVNVKHNQLKIDKSDLNANAGDILRRVFVNPKNTLSTISQDANAGDLTINVSSVSGFASGQTISFNESTSQYVIQSVGNSTLDLRTALNEQILADSTITLHERTYETIADSTITRSTKGSDTLFVKSSDNILNNATYTLLSGLTNAQTEFSILRKSIYNETQNQVTLDKEVSADSSTQINLMVANDTEQRDVALFYADNQGEWGNEITIQVSASKDYPNDCRVIKVFENGLDTGETFEVAFKYFVDGLGKQKHIESVINGNSSYIRVKHNPLAVDSEGNPLLPLLNDYALWQPLAEDIFKDSGVTIKEDLNIGDTDIVVSDYSKFELGDRIKFGNETAEYKVSGKSSKEILVGGKKQTEFHITIDREIVVDFIANNSKILSYSYTQAKPIKKLESTYPAKALNSTLTISNEVGNLIDCGTNKFIGGNNGSTPDTADLIQALKVFENREKISVNYLLDGGVYNSSYQQKIVSLCENREDCFAYLSSDPISFTNEDAVTIAKLQDFRNSTNINSSYCKYSANWALIYDEHNKRDVWVSMDGFLSALQSYNANDGLWAKVSAGWQSGKVQSVIKLNKVWSATERDLLLDMQLNPIKVMQGKGLCVWGNKTGLTTRSYLQMANVRWILIQTNILLRNMLEDMQWEITDSSKREAITLELQHTLWNLFNSVLNDLQVFDKTTTKDEDAGNVKIYVGLQPKGVAENFYVTLGIFSNSKTISEG